ncbi:MAG TPA: DUF1232 domain-containing protein [Longimicrobiales bacterium]
MELLPRRKRRGARAAVAALISRIPQFLRLFFRLLRDPRVSKLDRALVLATIAYVLTPTDLLPDFLGFLGLVDDLYLLALAFDRLLHRAGESLVLEHWDGEPETLAFLVDGLDEIGSFLPAPARALIRGRVRDA